MCCSVNGSVCLVCCVLGSVGELFGETIRNMLGVVDIVLLNVMEVISAGEVLCCIDREGSSKVCVCSACDPSLVCV